IPEVSSPAQIQDIDTSETLGTPTLPIPTVPGKRCCRNSFWNNLLANPCAQSPKNPMRFSRFKSTCHSPELRRIARGLKRHEPSFTPASSSSEEPPLALMTATTTLNLGFLTVVRDAIGFLGGYLVTNRWGRPLEFRLSTAVQPNRVQQILYGDTLEPYLCAEVIGKTLVEKTAAPAQLFVTDQRPMLDLRWRVDAPVIWLAAAEEQANETLGCLQPATETRPAIYRHPNFPADDAGLRPLLHRVESMLDLSEPFERVREAMHEAQKMGVTNRG